MTKVLPSNTKVIEFTVDVDENTDPSEIEGIGKKFWDVLVKNRFLIVTEQEIMTGKRFTFKLYVLQREE